MINLNPRIPNEKQPINNLSNIRHHQNVKKIEDYDRNKPHRIQANINR